MEEDEAPPPECVGILPNLYKSLIASSRSIKRSRYVRLRGTGGAAASGRRRTLRLGGRRRLRLPQRPKKVRLRLRMLRWLSPMRLLRRLRDAYVRMMLSLAEQGNLSAAVMGGGGIYVSGGVPYRQPMDHRREEEIAAFIEDLRRRRAIQAGESL